MKKIFINLILYILFYLLTFHRYLIKISGRIIYDNKMYENFFKSIKNKV